MIKQTLNPKNWLPQAAALSVAVLIYVVYNLLDSLIIGGAAGVLTAIPAVAIPDFLYTDYILPRLEARKQEPVT